MRARDRLGRPVPVGSPEAVAEPAPVAVAEALAAARALAAEGRWFSAHDVLEEAWKADRSGPWQGLAQLCVGMTHLQRGNPVGGARLLRRGALRLRAHGGSAELDVAALAAAAERLAASVEAGAEPAEDALVL